MFFQGSTGGKPHIRPSSAKGIGNGVHEVACGLPDLFRTTLRRASFGRPVGFFLLPLFSLLQNFFFLLQKFFSLLEKNVSPWLRPSSLTNGDAGRRRAPIGFPHGALPAFPPSGRAKGPGRAPKAAGRRGKEGGREMKKNSFFVFFNQFHRIFARVKMEGICFGTFRRRRPSGSLAMRNRRGQPEKPYLSSNS